MKIQHTTLFSVLILTATTFTANESRGQADPASLRSWNKAQEDRQVTMTSTGRIALENEPGIPLIIQGRLFRPDGTSAGGVVVHAYHRDRNGFDFGRQLAPKVFLSDDPLVTADRRRRSKEAGEFGWVREDQTADGVQHVDVRIRLREKAEF